MDRRKIYTIALKLLTLFGVVIVMAVMINSLFPASSTKETKTSMGEGESQTITESLEFLISGKMMLVQWAGKPVAILKRINPSQDFTAGEPLNSEWRSVKAEYFVFYNVVGAAQCPLYLNPDGERLKDTCTGIMFDTTGKRIKASGDSLQIPPHYFDDVKNSIVIGEWTSIKEQSLTTEGTDSKEKSK